jgi:recombination protein RecT
MSDSSVTKFKKSPIAEYLDSPAVRQGLNDQLKNKADSFMLSLINLTNSDANLQKCQPKALVACAIKSAILNLPLEKQFSYAYIIPYGGVPNFQIGYRGWIQLALRTGQYKKMNAVEIRKGELKYSNPVTEEYEFEFIQDDTKRENTPIIGYVFYFETIYGYKKTLYWSEAKCVAHGKRYSKTFNRSDSKWKTDLPSMCLKTVVIQGLTKWGMMSPDMKDQEIMAKAMSEDGDYDWSDVPEGSEPLDKKDEVTLPPKKNAPEVKKEDPQEDPAESEQAPEIPEDNNDGPSPAPPAESYEEEAHHQSHQPTAPAQRKPVFDFEKNNKG